MENEEKTEEQKAEDFVKEYQQLCKKHGFFITVIPGWAQSRDTGDWKMTLTTKISKL